MKRKIMVVDDNPDLVYMVKKGLERLSEDYEVLGAENGKQCFDLLYHDQKPSLILLDIMMPEIDGWDVFARIKKNPDWNDIPIVFLTAKTDEYSHVFGTFTAEAYIEKPFEIKDLKRKIDILLQNEGNHND